MPVHAAVRLGNTGFESRSKVPCFVGASENGLRSDAETDATSPDLARLVALWPSLDVDTRARLLSLAERSLESESILAGR